VTPEEYALTMLRQHSKARTIGKHVRVGNEMILPAVFNRLVKQGLAYKQGPQVWRPSKEKALKVADLEYVPGGFQG
jgi:hypothetical protein